MAFLSEGTKERLNIVINLTKTVFHYGFIPTVLYLGFKKGADPGMPEITLSSLLW
ncbi:PREDICTED: mitochondrial import receptor subunit TOM7 homolog [Nicrophorus vespilloides]|uniref:Mitochondrial import receptor subunit TOM7 homolog n=1 Tax=Nicrophorus vespilloides TaxID=110193 RepID=A0ABM1N562_NICVS|nr:PREDICTED: mitochondrial import receptor subunit TOM7 homolog [Nicrophorus vespilloides]